MSLGIRTFDNRSRSGDPLFKALGHPAVTGAVHRFIDRASGFGSLALVDPWGQYSSLDALYDLGGLRVEARYVQRVEDLSEPTGKAWQARSLLDLRESRADAVLLAAFDDEPARRAVRPLLPRDMPILTFDELRIDASLVTNARRYLDPINFCTNFALFRAGRGRRSVVRTAEYWSGYGAAAPRLYMVLFDGDGTRLATWEDKLTPRQSIVLDAGEIRERFGLAAFEGMLFIHAVGIAGHDTMKYVLDDIDDANADPAVTHDSNSWPAEFYSGLPAPRDGESVRLWLQNTHPGTIPAAAMTMNPMGGDESRSIEVAIPGFASRWIDVATLFPGLKWPAQLEINTGNHVIRPRYEILGADTVTFAHMNVERTDLKPDPAIAGAAPLLGKGYLLPAPVFPVGRWRNLALPTPAARAQAHLPLSIAVYDSEGRLAMQAPLGVHERKAMPEIDVNALLAEAGISDEAFAGHLELLYDFTHGVDVDGWLHALFRYEDRQGRQMGDTSFGAHVFNLPVTFRDEPQSYAGRPPGLSTRLFARLLPRPLEPFVHLTYPCSGTWLAQSDTRVTLHAADGSVLGEAATCIPSNGSRIVRPAEMFAHELLDRAGYQGYMIIADKTCRLFGYHGATGPDGQFALDHMFGF